jgi:hypothetical protein
MWGLPISLDTPTVKFAAYIVHIENLRAVNISGNLIMTVIQYVWFSGL